LELQDPAWSGIVCRERKQDFVASVHRLIREKLVAHEVHVLDAGVNVRFHFRDVTRIHFLTRGWHDLHHPNGTDRADSILIQQ
jgi:hypothetical protein